MSSTIEAVYDIRGATYISDAVIELGTQVHGGGGGGANTVLANVYGGFNASRSLQPSVYIQA